MPEFLPRSFVARPKRALVAAAAVILLSGVGVVTTAGLAQASSGPVGVAAPAATATAADDTAATAVTAQPMGVGVASPSGDAPEVDAMGVYPTGDYTADAAALPTALVDSLERDLGISPTEYLAEADAAVDAVAVVDSLTARGVQVDSSRLDGTRLVVTVGSQADAAVASAAGAIVESAPAEAVDIDGLSFAPAFDVSGGEGYAWTTTAKANSQCSIGVTGYRVSDGRPMALTAGHCVAGMASISGPVKQLVQSAPGASGSFGQAIGSPADSRFGGGFDGGLITIDGAQAVQTPSVVTWGGGTHAARSSAPLPVTDQSAAIVGANLCKSGSRTGWTCGTVKGVDRTVDVGGNQVNSILATTCIQPGDSGGPALIGTTVVGVNSSTSSVACGDAAYISAFFPMISAAGRASVATQLGSVWEPAFTVSAPVVRSVTVGPSGAAATVSGTVAHTSGSVAIYIDGATTPAATVPVKSGAWTLDAAALATNVAEGSHRVVAITRLGAWSRSAPSTEADILIGGSPKQVTGALVPADVVVR